MTELAGEVAEVFLGHPLQTERFLREFTIPALERGLVRSGRSREQIDVGLALFTATTDEERERVRRRVAFYASTPQYRHILTMHGWDGLGSSYTTSRAPATGRVCPLSYPTTCLRRSPSVARAPMRLLLRHWSATGALSTGSGFTRGSCRASISGRSYRLRSVGSWHPAGSQRPLAARGCCPPRRYLTTRRGR